MLYNEFRPKKFNDIVGQGHITEIIRNQVAKKSVSHAYLFSGTRGTGKTTTAKVLAKAVNCLNPKDGEPCGTCEMCKKIEDGNCIDVIEMDAASKRRIEDMRNIISSLNYPTTEAKFRVIILDEVHMLTQEAVNAFLKTLEEPPQNTIFILATTDPQKLPATILSRCQRFNFRRVSIEDIYKRLKYISEKSSIKVDDKSLVLISKVSDGGMRDAVSILDQVKDLNNVSYKEVSELLGASGDENMFRLSSYIFERNIPASLELINYLDNQGVDFNVFIKDLMRFLRHILMSKVMGNEANSVIPMAETDIARLSNLKVTKEEVINIIELFQKIDSRDRTSLELAVIKAGSFVRKPDEGKSNKGVDNANYNEVDFEEKVKKITFAKKQMVGNFKKLPQYKALGDTFEKSRMFINKIMEIKIVPATLKEKNILEEGYTWLEKGYKQFSGISDLKIIICGNGGKR
jgi:DNA polymerase-3 subunit gamma/tau